MIPLETAFLAKRPAAIKESGLEVLVQEVIAAITTDPWFKVYYFPSNSKVPEFLVYSSVIPYPLNPTLLVKSSGNSLAYSETATLSWGLLGPEIEGFTVVKSNSKTSPVKDNCS